MKLLSAVAAAFALGAAAPAGAQESEAFLQQFAEAVRTQLPIVAGHGFVVTRAEGREGVLVVLVEDRNDVAAGMPPGQAARQLALGLAHGFCEKGDEFSATFFGKGLKLRADLVSTSGERIEGEIVDDCPQ